MAGADKGCLLHHDLLPPLVCPPNAQSSGQSKQNPQASQKAQLEDVPSSQSATRSSIQSPWCLLGIKYENVAWGGSRHPCRAGVGGWEQGSAFFSLSPPLLCTRSRKRCLGSKKPARDCLTVENQAPNGQQKRYIFLDGKSECGKGEGGSGTLKSDQRRSGLWKESILSHLDPFS